MKNRLFTLIVFVALSALLMPSCFANCIKDSVPEIKLSCVNPDSLNIEHLEFLNAEVTIHGYYNATSPHKRLSYDEAYKIAEMDSFPSIMLDRKNIKFKTKRINVPNFGKCQYYIFQFKHYPGCFLNGMVHILYNSSKNEYLVFREFISNIKTEGKYLLLTYNIRGNLSYNRLLYSKELSRFLLECK